MSEPETERLTLAERLLTLDPPVFYSATHLGVGKDEDGWEHDAWRCTLRRDGHRVTRTFRAGLGWEGRKPTTAEFLDSLLSDAATVESDESFAVWCAELGYDPNSRKAEKVYRACQTIAEALQRLLGDEYAAFLWETERL